MQPLVVPADGLGRLEDMLNQDPSFQSHSGFDISDVWQARGFSNATELLHAESVDDRGELNNSLLNKSLYVQRLGRTKGQLTEIGATACIRELKSMAHAAKVAREERGMIPLFLCIGLLQWSYQSSGTAKTAEAPLILVPVNLSVGRRNHITMTLDSPRRPQRMRHSLSGYAGNTASSSKPSTSPPWIVRASTSMERSRR